MTIKGSLLAFKDEPPRMRMRLPAPGIPELDVIRTPGVLPKIKASGVEKEPFWKDLVFTLTTEPVKSLMLEVP